MTPYQAKGASSRKTKNKCKCKHGRRESQVKVKQEIKEEPKDGAELIQYSPPPSPVAPSIVNIKSESESDNELVDIKIEIKCEGECSKKDCDSAKEAGNMNGNESNGPIGENQNAPKKNSNIDRKRRLREKKKARKGRSSKQPAAKGPKKHKCHFCDYASSYKSHITIHIRTHTGEKPFECEICALAFADQSNLNRHKKIHVPKCPFSCSKCRRGFTKEAEKINHENDCKAHQYACYLCGTAIWKVSQLKRHIRIHSGVMPFACHICSKAFARNYDLKKHLRTHIKQLPFACIKYGQRFVQENEKQLHEDRCIAHFPKKKTRRNTKNTAIVASISATCVKKQSNLHRN